MGAEDDQQIKPLVNGSTYNKSEFWHNSRRPLVTITRHYQRRTARFTQKHISFQRQKHEWKQWTGKYVGDRVQLSVHTARGEKVNFCWAVRVFSQSLSSIFDNQSWLVRLRRELEEVITQLAMEISEINLFQSIFIAFSFFFFSHEQIVFLNEFFRQRKSL